MRFLRIIPFAVAAVSWSLLQLVLFEPRSLYLSLAFGQIVFLLAVRQYVKAAAVPEHIGHAFLQPAIVYTCLTAVTLFLPSRWLAEIVYLIISIYCFSYFRGLHDRLIRPEKADNRYFESLSLTGNFISFYAAATTLYGLMVYVSAPTWRLMLALLVLVLLITYQTFWSGRLLSKEAAAYLLVLGLVLVELGWAISSLSVSFYVLGLVLAICYYVAVGLTRFHLKGTLSARSVKLYLGYGLLSIAIALLTANWVAS